MPSPMRARLKRDEREWVRWERGGARWFSKGVGIAVAVEAGEGMGVRKSSDQGMPGAAYK